MFIALFIAGRLLAWKKSQSTLRSAAGNPANTEFSRTIRLGELLTLITWSNSKFGLFQDLPKDKSMGAVLKRSELTPEVLEAIRQDLNFQRELTNRTSQRIDISCSGTDTTQPDMQLGCLPAPPPAV